MTDRYPSDWGSRRKRVYRRDNYQCQNCGERGGAHGDAELHAHHVVPISKGGSHDTSNLTTVCHGCHEAIHGHPVGGGTRTSSATTNSEAGPGHIAVVAWTALYLVIGIPLVSFGAVNWLFYVWTVVSIALGVIFYVILAKSNPETKDNPDKIGGTILGLAIAFVIWRTFAALTSHLSTTGTLILLLYIGILSYLFVRVLFGYETDQVPPISDTLDATVLKYTALGVISFIGGGFLWSSAITVTNIAGTPFFWGNKVTLAYVTTTAALPPYELWARLTHLGATTSLVVALTAFYMMRKPRTESPNIEYKTAATFQLPAVLYAIWLFVYPRPITTPVQLTCALIFLLVTATATGLTVTNTSTLTL